MFKIPKMGHQSQPLYVTPSFIVPSETLKFCHIFHLSEDPEPPVLARRFRQDLKKKHMDLSLAIKI